METLINNKRNGLHILYFYKLLNTIEFGGIAMKKLLVVLLILASVLTYNSFTNKSVSASGIKDKLIRFHVIANSDLDGDQEVKLKVRDAILKAIGPRLEKSSSRDESLAILNRSLPEIERIANDILIKEGKPYRAKAVLGDFNFPVKTYNSITLPAGEYKALRVVLGKGDGKNWWCVMFPPLCFIDITRGYTSEKTDEELKKVLKDEEVESITAFKQQTEKKEVVSNNSKGQLQSREISSKSSEEKVKQISENKVEFRFKTVDFLKSTIEKIRDMF